MKKALNIIMYLAIFPAIPILFFLILFAFWDNYTGIVVIETLICIICMIIVLFLFPYSTNKLHNMSNDNFKLDINELKKNGGVIYAEFKENKWIVDIQDRKLEFALKNYPFQKSYICAFFIRQLLYYQINKTKKPLRWLFKNCTINKLVQKELDSVVINFHINNQVKQIYIAKNFKSLNKGIKRIIIKAPYYWAEGIQNTLQRSILNKRIKNLDEKKYWDYSSVKVRIARYNQGQ